MAFGTTTKTLLLVALTATALPAAAIAKPNSYPGENSKFKSSDPAVIAQQKAEQKQRFEERKKRREERRFKRLNRKKNRLN